MATDETTCSTAAQRHEALIKQFVSSVKAGGGPEDDFLRDVLAEVSSCQLQGALLERRDRAVALYWHRGRMAVLRTSLRRRTGRS
jgi:hypothetical protein